MWFEFKMAWRFLKSGKTQSFLILLGIVVGVAVQVFLGSLIEGLQQDLIDQTVGAAPHITISPENNAPRSLSDVQLKDSKIITFSGDKSGINSWREVKDYLNKQDKVKGIAPIIDGSGFALRGQKNVSVLIRGVNLEEVDTIYNLFSNIKDGKAEVGGNNILIGVELATELDLKVGDSLKLNTADGLSDRFMIKGIFDLKSKELNKSWIFMSRRRAGSLFDLSDQVSKIELQVAEVFSANQVADQVMDIYPEIQADSWQRNNQQLLTALQSQSSSSLVIQVFIIIAVTLGIASVLAVSVVQKSRQIGILKAMGTVKKKVGLIFLIQGGILGLIGSILGSATGIALSQLFVNLVRTERGAPLFPITINIKFILLSIVVATLAGMIAALIPARNSAKLNPIEVIRNG